ncbi:uncharacterized protein LOC113235215 isoform X2 [Hyposmocoma kahamanoa]|uniref:uncharacterized protein LOC113235215 isoform X2 n=1 Tax=Hyposmocoma kahamanoa TaxID=1477025 RepID=UPI000E6D9BD2|nr:uncharacterized protein LOC113235215 isoform X2 [Hyposmocoma kahamanoa]
MDTKLIQVLLYYVVLVVCQNNVNSVQEKEITINEIGYKHHQERVVVNSKKYPYESFLRDEQTLEDVYKEYVSWNDAPMKYENGFTNNLEISKDKQKRFMEKTISEYNIANERNKLINDVERGFIRTGGLRESPDRPFRKQLKMDTETNSTNNASYTVPESQDRPVEKETKIDAETDGNDNATYTESPDQTFQEHIKNDTETDSNDSANHTESDDLSFKDEISMDAEMEYTDSGNNSDKLNDALYDTGVKSKLFEPKKYTRLDYKGHVPIFQSTYKEFVELMKKPMEYKPWLTMNTFGILQDVNESLLNEKSSEDYKKNKNKFMSDIQRGDILLTNGNDKKGTLGLAALVIDNHNILEMLGYQTTISRIPYEGMTNNLRVTIEHFFSLHLKDWIYIYRCSNSTDANSAAVWAHHSYYNPKGLYVQTENISYEINSDFMSTNPSYNSKLVLQAYYFGSDAIDKKNVHNNTLVFPTTISKYFKEPLKYVGKY